MAKATKVETKAVVIQGKTEVTLVLDGAEAQFLMDVLASIGGCGDTTRRKHQERISDALRGVGYSFTSTDSPKRDWAGSIMFYETNEAARKAMQYRGTFG